ncbi:MAG: GntR family transcriptional regulator [Sphingomonadales bacterium]
MIKRETAATSPIERKTTAAEVATFLRRRIVGGHYEAGQFLRQEAIAQELGVSRLPVREALALLEAEGFVVREKYRGALIPRLSTSEIAEIYQLRGMLEPHLLEHAIPNITPDVIAEGRRLIEDSRACEDANDWADLNWSFHKALYLPANLPLCMQMLEQLLMRADRYLKMQRNLSRESQQESDGQHQHILDLIAGGKGNEALAVLREHISWNADDVRQTLDRILTAP